MKFFYQNYGNGKDPNESVSPQPEVKKRGRKPLLREMQALVPTQAIEPTVIQQKPSNYTDLEEEVVTLYAKGMTTRDIHQYIKQIYNIDVAQPTISAITDKVLPLMKEWQVRPLSSLYTFLYLDGIFFKVRTEGRIVSKCAYIALGINSEGLKEVLGIWVKESEGAKFWLQVLTEIKNRGVSDILIACIDGLKGFGEAIKTVYPEAQIQQCIFHQIRHTVKYVPHKYRQRFCDELKEVYTAPTEEAGLRALDNMKDHWPQYSFYLKSWETKWPELSAFFNYPQPIRRIMYTTNAIENLNMQFRKVTKTTVIFPHEDSLYKLLWLAQEDIARRWTMPIRNWGEVVSQLAIIFPEKIEI